MKSAARANDDGHTGLEKTDLRLVMKKKKKEDE